MVASPQAVPPLPVATSELARGLWSGRLDVDPVFFGHRRGRVRRWLYAAAGDPDGDAVGAAIVDLGYVGTAFVWAVLDGEMITWEQLRPLAVGIDVGRLPASGASFRDRVVIGGDGSLTVDVLADDHGRLRAELAVLQDVTPAVLVTDTAGGGWNATSKAAGYEVAGSVDWDGQGPRPFGGGGWRDWTVGRQDRRTVWRWAAGAGSAADGRRVGLNVSTGMNDAGAGEDVVWWDGVPHPLEVDALAPLGEDAAGPWVVAGPTWRLELEAAGVRAASEAFVVVSSRYVQPVGRLRGTLPGPDGRPVEVTLTGVTEDHEARW